MNLIDTYNNNRAIDYKEVEVGMSVIIKGYKPGYDFYESSTPIGKTTEITAKSTRDNLNCCKDCTRDGLCVYVKDEIDEDIEISICFMDCILTDGRRIV
jgi:hypothetical protein